MERLARVQPAILAIVLPAAAVKLRVPSVSVAPTGIAVTIRDCSVLLSPARPLIVSVRVPRRIADPSRTRFNSSHAIIAVAGLSVTDSVALAVLVLPLASFAVAVTLK